MKMIYSAALQRQIYENVHTRTKPTCATCSQPQDSQIYCENASQAFDAVLDTTNCRCGREANHVVIRKHFHAHTHTYIHTHIHGDVHLFVNYAHFNISSSHFFRFSSATSLTFGSAILQHRCYITVLRISLHSS